MPAIPKGRFLRPRGYNHPRRGSVGFDGKDDGGKRGLDENKPENTKFNDEKYLGDWVWDFPAKQRCRDASLHAVK